MKCAAFAARERHKTSLNPRWRAHGRQPFNVRLLYFDGASPFLRNPAGEDRNSPSIRLCDELSLQNRFHF